MFKPTKPNAFTFEMMERNQAIDNAIQYFIGLYHDDVDINDSDVQAKVFKHYSLEDLTNAEKAKIATAVERALR